MISDQRTRAYVAKRTATTEISPRTSAPRGPHERHALLCDGSTC
jgi:hypothetical protein